MLRSVFRGSLAHGDLYCHARRVGWGQGDDGAIDRLPIDQQSDLVARPGAPDLNLVNDAAEGARGPETLPRAGEDRGDFQAIIGGTDAQDPLCDGDVVPG